MSVYASIYGKQMSSGTFDASMDMFRPEPEVFSYGEMEDPSIIMPDGRGGVLYGNSRDWALLNAADPEKFNTVAHSEQMLVTRQGMNAGLLGFSGGNVSGDFNADVMLGRRQVFESVFGEALGTTAGMYSSLIWNEDNIQRDIIDRRGDWGLRPGFVGARPGEDEPFMRVTALLGTTPSAAASGETALSAAQRLATQRGDMPDPNDFTPEAAEQRANAFFQILYDMGQIPEERYQAGLKDKGARDSIIDAAREDVLLARDDAMRFDTSVFPELSAEAQSRNLDPYTSKVYVYERASQNVQKSLYRLMNKEYGEDPTQLMMQVVSLANTVGPDFVEEAMASVRLRDDKWIDSAWESIPAAEKYALSQLGFDKNNFMRDKDGNMMAGNPYTYLQQAKDTVLSYAGEQARELMMTRDFHQGWADWTRRLSDTIRTDIAGDPVALYGLAAGVGSGLAAGLAFGAGAAAGVATNVGRTAAFAALDGLSAGALEGYIVSESGQINNIVRGAQTEIDYDGVVKNVIMMGGLGALGGGLIGGGIAGLGPSLRGASNAVRGVADSVLSSGWVGDAAAVRALNRAAAAQATHAEIEGAQLFANIQNEGLIIRLNRGEVEAKEALAEVIPVLVRRNEGEEISELVEELFSSERLAAIGVSHTDVVDLVYGIQRRLGPGGQIGSDQFDKIVREFFSQVMEDARKFGKDVAGSTDMRIARIDATMKSKYMEAAGRFVGGSGAEALSEAEVAGRNGLRDLTQKLIEAGKAGTKQRWTQKHMEKLIKLALRLNDEKPMREVLQVIAASGRLADDELKALTRRVDELAALGKRARKDKFVRKLLKVENAMEMLRNERTIQVARELGVTPKRMLTYIRKFKGAYGDLEKIAELDAQNPGVRSAIEEIAKGKGLEVHDALPTSFNVQRFLDEDTVTERIRDMQAFRTQQRNAVKRILRKPNMDQEELVKQLEKLANRKREVYRKLSSELGYEMEVEEALTSLLSRFSDDIPFGMQSSALKSSKLKAAVNKLLLAQAPDKISITARSEDGWWIGNLFRETSLGQRFERIMAAISTWPIAQQRLFRSRNRVVRGISNWITGQHVSNRVFSNSNDFMSIESIVEGASREAMPYMVFSRGVRQNLGSQSYREFDTLFLYLRQKGYFKGGLTVENLQEAGATNSLLKAYADFGGVEQLVKDLNQAQKMFTSVMTRSLDEAAEAGYPIAADATRYIPNSIRGGLTAERARQFVDGFVKLRSKQLLTGTAKLDFDVLDSLGWIRLTKGGEVDAAGRTLKDKRFIVPEDSPFWRGTQEKSIEFAENVIKSGWENLRRLSPETEAGTEVASAPQLGIVTALRGDDVNISRIRSEIGEISGTEINRPLGRAADDAAIDDGVAGVVSGLDPITRRLEQAHDELMRSSRAVRAAWEEETGESFTDLVNEVRRKMMVRRRAAIHEVNQTFVGATQKPIRRKPMNMNQKLKHVNDREAYDSLSDGHRALTARLDNLIVEGVLDEDSARIVMLAFVDVDPHIMLGMSFGRMDVLESGTLGRAFGQKGNMEGLVLLRGLAERGDDDAVNIAATLVHETSHIAFLSAPARLQGAIQSLYLQAKNGGNDIVDLLIASGVRNIDHALSNVHEFAAALAEVTLVRNQVVQAKGPLRQFLEHLGKFWKSLIGKVAVATNEAETIGVQILGKEKYGAVRSAIRGIYDMVPDETPVDRLVRTFGVDIADEIDEFGATAASRKSLAELKQDRQMKELMLEEMRRKPYTEEEFLELARLRALGPDEMSEEQLERFVSLSQKLPEKTQREIQVIEDDITRLSETISRAEAPKEVTTAPKAPTKADRSKFEGIETNDLNLLKSELEKQAGRMADDDPNLDPILKQMTEITQELKLRKSGPQIVKPKTTTKLQKAAEKLSKKPKKASVENPKLVKDETRESGVRVDFGDPGKMADRPEDAAEWIQSTLFEYASNPARFGGKDKPHSEDFLTALGTMAMRIEVRDGKLVYVNGKGGVTDLTGRDIAEVTERLRQKAANEARRRRTGVSRKGEGKITQEAETDTGARMIEQRAGETETPDQIAARQEATEAARELVDAARLSAQPAVQKAAAESEVAVALESMFGELGLTTRVSKTDPNQRVFDLPGKRGSEERKTFLRVISKWIKDEYDVDISPTAIQNHASKNGILNNENINSRGAILREFNESGEADAVRAKAMSAELTEAAEEAVEEAAARAERDMAADTPVVQETVAKTSAGAEPLKDMDPIDLLARANEAVQEDPEAATRVVLGWMGREAEPDLFDPERFLRERGDVPGLPGYTRLTREELDAKVDKHDSVFAFLADGVQQAQDGEGVSFSRELAEYFNARKAATAPEAEAPAPKVPEAEAPAPKVPEAEAPAPKVPEAEAPAPKVPEAGDGGAKPPKPPKAPAGAGDAGKPPRRPMAGVMSEVEEYFKRAKAVRTSAGDINTAFRNPMAGRSLSDLYRMAVEGNMSVLRPGYAKMLQDRGMAVMAPLERIGHDYLDHAGGSFKTGAIDSKNIDTKIGVLDEVSNLHQRTFHDVDLDAEGGEELARLFAESGSSTEGLMRYADTTLSSIRVQKAINELTDSKGAGMKDIFEEVQSSLELNLRSDARGRKRTLTEEQVKRDVDRYMMQLKLMYMRARGFTPRLDDSFSSGTRIAQNLTYSVLGAKFAMSVLFVEAPLAVLRSSGLNPLKLVANTTQIGLSLARAAGMAAGDVSPTMKKFMSAFGIDSKIMKDTLEDMVYYTSNMRPNSLSKFGQVDGALAESGLLMGMSERVRAHARNIKGAVKGEGDTDPSFLTRLVDTVEATTAVSADLTGVMSFMTPVTHAVREVASNQGKGLLLKHSDKLIELSARISARLDAGEPLSLDQIVGEARRLGIPKQLAAYAASSGLLSKGVMETIMTTTGLNRRSAGRLLDMNHLQQLLEEDRMTMKSTTVGRGYNLAVDSEQATRDRVLPALNNFLMYMTGEMSPELRGTMRFQGMNPFTDLMFQMLSYPMAAYQALVGNGVRSRGAVMTTGLLAALAALEYSNRNLQTILFSDKEKDRKIAIERMTKMPDMNDVITILGTHGVSSPLFGATGSYMRDLVGNPLLQASGQPQNSFRARPFSSPAIGVVGRLYGSVARAAGNAGAAVAGTGSEKRQTSAFSAFGRSLYDVSPLNALPLGQAYKAYDNLTDAYKAGVVGSTVGSFRNVPELSSNWTRDLPFFKWYNSDLSPTSWDQVPYDKPAVSRDVPTLPEPTPAPAASPSSSAPASAGEGLADALQRRSK